MDKYPLCADNGFSPSAKREQATVSDLRQHFLSVGTAVEVRSRFADRWVPGFVVLAADDAGYRLSRTSDGGVIPVSIPPNEVRAAT